MSLRIVLPTIFVATLIASSIQPAAAVTPLAQTDVAAFASRAEQWVDARDDHRDEAHEVASDLAEAARQAEAAQQAEIEAAAAAAAEPPPTTTAPAPTTTAAPPSTTAAPPPTETATTAAPASGAPTAAQWEALRQCEASGNYGAVSANGRYRGAYQFSQETWDWVAGSTDPSLVGVDPASASSAQQDAMALGLWQLRGWSPWPLCGSAAAAA